MSAAVKPFGDDVSLDELMPFLSSLEWRLDNLYWVVNKEGKAVRFVMNEQQRKLIRNLWHRNIIVKARQLGFSTLMQVLQLDQSIFKWNFTGVVISDTLPNAGKLFAKIEFAYNRMPQALREAFPLATRIKGAEIGFEHKDSQGLPNPSTISVSVSARGGTVTLLHVSELGPIGIKFPARAEEIKTGTLPAVPRDACVVIESTASGPFGLFYELAEPAIKRAQEGKPETVLDYRLHFFPWFECADYALSDEDTALVDIPLELQAYFRKLEAELKITLTRQQRAWYAKTKETQKKKMKAEYPSTPQEAFEQAIEGAVYGDEMTWLREQGRLGRVPLDPNYPVNTFWDLGTRHVTAVWFHQLIGTQHRWFYYHQEAGRGLGWWWREFLEPHRERNKYRWGRHFLPHDAENEMLGENVETKKQILEKAGMKNIVVVPRVATIAQGIEVTKKALGGSHFFDSHMPNLEAGEDWGCGQGIKCLDGYQYVWDDKHGRWSTEPLENWATDGADAWRQHAQGWQGNTIDDDALLAFANRERSWR